MYTIRAIQCLSGTHACFIQCSKHGSSSTANSQKAIPPRDSSPGLSPSPVNLEKVVKFSLVISAASGAVNLLERLPGRKRDLIGGNADNRAILQVKPVDIGSSLGMNLFPFEE